MSRSVFSFLFSLLVTFSFAQHQDPSWSARRAIINEQSITGDSLSNVLHQLGTFEGHLRTYFMTTTNHEDYPDYYALAMGGGLGYYSPIIKNFQLGMSGFIIYNLASSNLINQPPFSNRYEIGLFDIKNPENHADLDRLEDLYLRYYLKDHHSYIQIGKFHLQTPLINQQDGRMRPNLQEGVWVEWNEWKKIKLKSGWLWRTSPRSTIQWFSIGESLGVYPGGRATNGEKADYAGNINTPGVAISNVSVIPNKALNVQLWNYYVPDLFTTTMARMEWRKKSSDAREWSLGVQYLWQNSLYNDTLSLEKQYITKDEQSHAVSTRLGFSSSQSKNEWNLNYTRITNHGRYLFPREWGVEPFYTFMYRERVEGAGNVHAVMLQNSRSMDKKEHLSLQTQAGVFWMPSESDAKLNKYAMPGFYQINVKSRYKFQGFLHGLQADLLYTYKGQLATSLEELPVFYHNKVDMHHFSLVLDYYF